MEYPIVMSVTLTTGKTIAFEIGSNLRMDAFLCALREKNLYIIPGPGPFRAVNCAQVCHVAAVN